MFAAQSKKGPDEQKYFQAKSPLWLAAGKLWRHLVAILSTRVSSTLFTEDGSTQMKKEALLFHLLLCF